MTSPVESPFELHPQRPDSTSSGSGFLVNRTGLVLTAYHLIEGSDPSSGITVQFQDSGVRPAVLVAENAAEDLALLRVDMHGLPPVRPIPFGDSTTVRVGDATLALANPFGLERTLTSGIVSALQPLIVTPDGFRLNDVIQTDTPIDPGSNGGPLLDADGRAIGITSQIEAAAANGEGTAPLAFAVPIDTAKQLLPPAGQGVSPASAFLGVSAAGGRVSALGRRGRGRRARRARGRRRANGPRGDRDDRRPACRRDLAAERDREGADAGGARVGDDPPRPARRVRADRARREPGVGLAVGLGA